MSGGTRMYRLNNGPVNGSKVWNWDYDSYYDSDSWLDTPNIRPYQGWDDERPNWWQYQIPTRGPWNWHQRGPRYYDNPWLHYQDHGWVEPLRLADMKDTNIPNTNTADI